MTETAYPACGAKTRRMTACRRPAGWGTGHPGDGRCKLHGGSSTGARNQTGNTNAVTHGAYETLMRERLPESERAAFDAMSVDTSLEAALRIVRFKLLRLIGDVDQNVHGKDSTWQVKADDIEKGRAVAYLVDAERKLVKEMQGGSDEGAEALAALGKALAESRKRAKGNGV